MAGPTKLRRDAGAIGLLYASLGSIIGSGWLFGALHAAVEAGPWSVFSWVIGAAAILLLAFVFAELATMFPRPMANIVGIDIDKRCAAHSAEGINVRIGDQSDAAFLQSVIDEFGVPDVVLDDGSHQMAHIAATFDFLYSKMPKNGVYLVEDLHTAYWPKFGGGLNEPANFFNLAKAMVDQLNADHTLGAVTPDAFTRDTLSIAFYDSVVVFEKGRPAHKGAIEIEGGKPSTARRPSRRARGA